MNGPSVRVVLDVGNWDNSRAVNHPGQSGDPESPHYRDLAPLWSEGTYFPLLYSRSAVVRATEQRDSAAARIALTERRQDSSMSADRKCCERRVAMRRIRLDFSVSELLVSTTASPLTVTLTSVVPASSATGAAPAELAIVCARITG